MTDESLSDAQKALATAMACSVILKNLPSVADLSPEQMARSAEAIFGVGDADQKVISEARKHATEIVENAQKSNSRRES